MKNPRTPIPSTYARPLLGAILSLFALPLLGQTAPSVTPAEQEEAQVLSPFEVTTSASRGYQASNAVSSTKFDLPIKDVPQTVTVLTAEFLNDLAASSLGEALPYVPGVAMQGGGRVQDGFTIRGFPVGLSYLDGFRDAQSWASGETAHISQLEVLKGPASNLYGNGIGFGGVVNRVSKRPPVNPLQTLDVTFGSYSFYRAAYDVGGPITADKSLLYRVNAVYTDSGSFRDKLDLRRFYIVPVVTKRFNENTSITFFGEFLRTYTKEDIGIPTVKDPTRSQYQLVVPDIPRSRSFAEDWQDTTLEKEALRVYFNHNFNRNWSLRTATNVMLYNNPIDQVEAVGVAADQRTFNRQAFRLNRWEDDFLAEADLLGHVQTGPFEHRLLMGYEWNREKGRSNVLRKPLTGIDIYAPVYGTPIPDFTGGEQSNLLYTNGIYAYYAHDQISMFGGKLQVFGGIRHDRATFHRVIELDAGRGLDAADPAVPNNAPRYGFLIKPVDNISLYAQYSESFRPIGGATTPTFAPVLPEHGSMKEVGVKTTFFGGRLGFDVAVYEIKDDDVAIRLDPPLQAYFKNAGQQTGNGVEINFSYNDEHWNIIGGFLNQDVRTTTPGVVNLGVDGDANNSGDVFVRYNFTTGPLAHLSVGGGALYSGERLLNNSTGKLPGYTRYDFLASYAYSRKLSVTLNVRNVFDKTYFFNSASFMVRPGDPLSFRLSGRCAF